MQHKTHSWTLERKAEKLPKIPCLWRNVVLHELPHIFYSQLTRWLSQLLEWIKYMRGIKGASQVVRVVENLPASAGDARGMGLISGLRRSPGGGHGNPLQCSCLQNPMDRGASQASVHEVAESDTTEATEHPSTRGIEKLYKCNNRSWKECISQILCVT